MDLAKIAQAEGTSSSPNEATIDDIVIRSYTEIGSLSGFGKLTIEAREWIVPDKRDIAHFIRVTAEGGGDYSRTASAIIPYERIDDVLSAIDQITNITINTERFAYSEVEFKIGDIKAVVFNISTGGKSGFMGDTNIRTSFGIQVDDVFVNLNQASRADEFKRLIKRAKDHIDKVR